MNIKTNYSLVKNNTFRVNAIAKKFAEVESVKDVENILSKAHLKNLPILILGDGANVLFLNDFEGIVIKVNIKGIKVIHETKDKITLEIGAGENWDSLVAMASKNNWGGIENMSLIPGTVGAAAAQNIAAYGQNLVDVFVSLDAINLKTFQIKTFNKVECGFYYRESVFKNELKNKFLITKIVIELSKNADVNVGYFETGNTYKSNSSLLEELKSFAKAPYSINDVRMAVINIRKKKLPDPDVIGTAGSFFKNPIVKKDKYDNLKKMDPLLQCYPVDKLTYPKLDDPGLNHSDYVKLPAGRLLDVLGWKGKRIGNVGTFQNQALAVVSYGASGEEILNFTKKMQADVLKNFGIKLEREVQLINYQ